jgi:hypothetical protein
VRKEIMQKENIWKLMARKMAGEATKEELNELENILKNDPVMNYTAETFSRLWNALSIQQTQGNNPAMGTCEDG